MERFRCYASGRRALNVRLCAISTTAYVSSSGLAVTRAIPLSPGDGSQPLLPKRRLPFS
jgi:hypothetical protein